MKSEQMDRAFDLEEQPSKRSLADSFGQIVRSDPKYFLGKAKELAKKKRDGKNRAGSRQEQEEKDQQKYALELASFISEACLPVSLCIESLDDSQRAWVRIFGRRRSRTLRNRVRAWARYRRWLVAAMGYVWPKSLSDVVNYIEEWIAKGAPKSAPVEFNSALALLEDVGRAPDTAKLTKDPVWQAHMKSWAVGLNKGACGRGPAPPFTVAIVLTLELFVCDSDEPFYMRFIAWFEARRFAKCRSHILQIISPWFEPPFAADRD